MRPAKVVVASEPPARATCLDHLDARCRVVGAAIGARKFPRGGESADPAADDDDRRPTHLGGRAPHDVTEDGDEAGSSFSDAVRTRFRPTSPATLLRLDVDVEEHLEVVARRSRSDTRRGRSLLREPFRVGRPRCPDRATDPGFDRPTARPREGTQSGELRPLVQRSRATARGTCRRVRRRARARSGH